ncbi:MAG: hypothetical protein IJ086_09665 [Clostridium sp.]|nr:hypothetical protein [Clostridium sp.]
MNSNTSNQDKYRIIYNTLSNGISDIEKEVQINTWYIKNSEKELVNKIKELEEKINSKNKIATGINIAILIMTILLFLVK